MLRSASSLIKQRCSFAACPPSKRQPIQWDHISWGLLIVNTIINIDFLFSIEHLSGILALAYTHTHPHFVYGQCRFHYTVKHRMWWRKSSYLNCHFGYLLPNSFHSYAHTNEHAFHFANEEFREKPEEKKNHWKNVHTKNQIKTMKSTIKTAVFLFFTLIRNMICFFGPSQTNTNDLQPNIMSLPNRNELQRERTAIFLEWIKKSRREKSLFPIMC